MGTEQTSPPSASDTRLNNWLKKVTSEFQANRPDLPEIKKFMTVQEACEIVGISDDYLYKQIKRNKGPRVTRFGRLFRIHPDDFRRWLDDPGKTIPRTTKRKP